MTKGLIDADAILNRAKPLVSQKAHEIQPFGHVVKPPIAGRERVQGMVQISRLLIRSNELQVWFVAEHVVDVPLTRAV